MVYNPKTVYTSIPGYVRLPKVIVKDYRHLQVYGWAKKKIGEMTKRPSPNEELFLKRCRAFRYNLFRQVFFQIDDKCYFLDFLLADKAIAIEIDGTYHRQAEIIEKDRARDAAFASIGITTLRFPAWQVQDPKFLVKYFNPAIGAVSNAPRIAPKKKVTAHQIRLQKLLDNLNECKGNSNVHVHSHETAFLRAISHGDRPKEGAKDIALLAKIYDVKADKKINIFPYYTGNRTKLRPLDSKWVQLLDAACAKHPAHATWEI